MFWLDLYDVFTKSLQLKVTRIHFSVFVHADHALKPEGMNSVEQLTLIDYCFSGVTELLIDNIAKDQPAIEITVKR